MSEQTKPKLHYAWKILIGSMLVALTGQGPLQVCTSNLTSAVVAEFGCQVNEFTLLTSISAVVMALLYPLASKILSTRHIGIVIVVGLVVEGSAYGLMSTYTSVRMFYISGVLLGLGGSIVSFMAFPILINMWFAKRAGFALGLIMACRSIGGAIWSPVFAELISTIGWRSSVQIATLVVLIVSVPCSILIFRRPQDLGMRPYGAEELEGSPDRPAAFDGEWGVNLATGFRTPVFYLVWITGIMFSLSAGCPSYFVSYSTMELGNLPTIGATAYSIMSITGIVCSLILGSLNDRFGVKAGLVWGCFFQLLGLSMVVLCGSSVALLMIGTACYGLGSGMYTLQVPLLVRSVLGGRYYAEIWPVLMLGNSLIGGGLCSSLALFYDIGGTYKGTFIFGAALVAIALVTGFISVDSGKRRRQKELERQKELAAQ